LLIVEPPVLLIVSVSGKAACPIGWTGKASCAGVTLMTGGCSATPERAILCVRSASETLRLPLMLPIVVGANTTLIAQLAWPVNWVPQVLDS